MNLDFPLLERIDAQLRRAPTERIAKNCQWSRRSSRKISPPLWIKALCYLASGPYMSLGHCAWLLSLLGGQLVSKQAVSKRIHAHSADFLQQLLGYFTTQRLQAAHARNAGKLSTFRRVLIQDSTTLQLPGRLAHRFAGCINQTKARISIVRIQAVLDLLTESFVHFSLSGYTRNDQAASRDILSFVENGDLVIRDLGYYVREVFEQLMSRGAFFISRLQPHSIIRDPDSHQVIPLLKRLRKVDAMDQWVLVGEKKQMKVRLLALRLPERIAQQRRRKARAKRDKRNQYSKEYYALLGWQILITNVSANRLNAQDLAEIYGLRWQVEVVFKSWKSHLNFKHIPQNAAAAQVETLIYARLIMAVLFHTIFWHLLQQADDPDEKQPVSMLKAATLMQVFCATFVSALIMKAPTPLLFMAFQRFAAYDKRKRINYVQRRAKLG